MSKSLKKYMKAKAKAEKKMSAERVSVNNGSKSPGVRFSESVKGLIYVVLAVSLFVALFLSNQGYVITRESILSLLFQSVVGRVVLVVLGLAFLIYGLKHLNLVK